MIKMYCDCCGEWIENNLNLYLSYLCHIDDIFDGKIEYTDNDDNATSKREVTIDLCINCYNEIMVSAIKKMRAIKEKRKI